MEAFSVAATAEQGPANTALQQRLIRQSSGTSLQVAILLGLGLGLPLHVSRWYEQRLKRRFALLMSEAGDARQRRCGREPLLAGFIEVLCWFAIMALGCCLLARLISAADLMDVRHCSWYGQAA
jgi:hypothetical protein